MREGRNLDFGRAVASLGIAQILDVEAAASEVFYGPAARRCVNCVLLGRGQRRRPPAAGRHIGQLEFLVFDGQLRSDSCYGAG